MIFVGAIVLGIALGIIIPYNLTSDTLPYVAVAIVAALDSVFGGIVAYFNKKFNMNIFVTGLVTNSILAVLITLMGNLLGISLYFAAIVVFGVRIFNNMATIRRTTLDIYFVRRNRDKERKRLLALNEHSETLDVDVEDKEKTETEKISEKDAE